MTICRCCGQPVARLAEAPAEAELRTREDVSAQAPRMPEARATGTTLHVDQDVHDCLNAAYDLAEQAGAAEVGLPALILAMARFQAIASVLSSFGLKPAELAEMSRAALFDDTHGRRERSSPRTGDEVRTLLTRCREMADRRGGGRIGIGDVLTALTSIEARQWRGNVMSRAYVARTGNIEKGGTEPSHHQDPSAASDRDAPRLRVSVPARSSHAARQARAAGNGGAAADRNTASLRDEREVSPPPVRQTEASTQDRTFASMRPAATASSATVLPLHQGATTSQRESDPTPATRAADERALRSLEHLMAGLRTDLARMTERLERAERTAQAEARRAANLERDLRARIDRERRETASLTALEVRLAELEAVTRSVMTRSASGGEGEGTGSGRSGGSGRSRRLANYQSSRSRRSSRSMRRLRQRLRTAREGRGGVRDDLRLLLEPDLEVAEPRIAASPQPKSEPRQVVPPDPREPEIEDDEDDVVAGDRPKRFYLTLDDDVVDAPSIGPRTAERLRPVGIRTVRDLLRARPARIAEGAGARHITPDRVLAWQQQARLVCTVPWLRGTHAQLLVGAGYTSAKMIAEADLDAMMAAILRFAGTRDGQSVLRAGPPPSIEKVIAWSEHAALAELDRAA